MSQVKIKFSSNRMSFILDADKIRDDFNAGLYIEESKAFEVDAVGEDAADEVFDLTNNPSRQDERVQKYGRGRSLSTGDIVEVDGKDLFACLSFGWEKL